MKRPVRPVALVVLTLCMIYPGVTMLYQGLYPLVAGEYFGLVAKLGPWMNLAKALHIMPVVVLGLKSVLGLAWIAGVLGLWAGDARAYPLVLIAAFGSVLYPMGPLVMGLIALFVLIMFGEEKSVVPA
jgi:hypothetical protein